MLDSLVRVSRRVTDGHYASVLATRARTSVPGGGIARAGYNTPRGGPHSRHLYPAARTDAGLRRAECPGAEPQVIRPAHVLAESASPSTVSRAVSLSFQSAFHLSLTLLVRYRSPACI